MDGRNRSLIPSETAELQDTVGAACRWITQMDGCNRSLISCQRVCEKERERETMPFARRTQSVSFKSQIRVIECGTFRLFDHRWQSRLQNASGAVLELQNEPENSKCGFVTTSFEPFLWGWGRWELTKIAG